MALDLRNWDRPIKIGDPLPVVMLNRPSGKTSVVWPYLEQLRPIFPSCFSRAPRRQLSTNPPVPGQGQLGKQSWCAFRTPDPASPEGRITCAQPVLKLSLKGFPSRPGCEKLSCPLRGHTSGPQIAICMSPSASSDSCSHHRSREALPEQVSISIARLIPGELVYWVPAEEHERPLASLSRVPVRGPPLPQCGEA